MKRRSGQTRLRLLLVQATAGLMFLLPACEPISAETGQEFVLDFARSALAAWLL